MTSGSPERAAGAIALSGTVSAPVVPATTARPPRTTPRRRRAGRFASVLLVAPLVLFILGVFVLPLLGVLAYAVRNPEVRAALPRVAVAMEGWKDDGPVPDTAFDALAADLRASDGSPLVAEAARRLNYENAGYRTLVLKTARALRVIKPGPERWRDAFEAIDPRWVEPATWQAVRRASAAVTPFYMLAALDLRVSDAGAVTWAPEGERLFLNTLGRTMWIGAIVTLTCLLIGYPLAHALVSLPGRFSAPLMLCVLLPFWTSLLVRTSAWIVVLQKQGLANSVLLGLGLTKEPLQLVFNRFGLYVAMVHILLPFMVLPILSVMKGLPPSYMRASNSLGAHPARGFLEVYLPLTLPGVGAGCLLTFIIAAGYYITPTLVGGAGDQMVGYFIAFYTNTTINWGMAAALGTVLLGCIMVLYATLGRLIGVSRIAGIE